MRMWMRMLEGTSGGAGEDLGREVEGFGVLPQLSVHRPCRECRGGSVITLNARITQLKNHSTQELLNSTESLNSRLERNKEEKQKKCWRAARAAQ